MVQSEGTVRMVEAIEVGGRTMAIPEGRSFLEAIFACIDDGIITIDASDSITFCNAKAGRILNLNPALIIGQHYQEAFNSRPQLGLIGRLHALRMQQMGGSIVRSVVEGEVPGRGYVHMDLSLKVVMDTRLSYLGMVMVIAAGSLC